MNFVDCRNIYVNNLEFKKHLFLCRFVLSLTISHILVSLLTVGVSMAALVHVSVHDLMEEISLYMTYGSGLVNSLTLTTISCERSVLLSIFSISHLFAVNSSSSN